MAPGQKGKMTVEELTAALDKANASIAKLETKNSELIDREKKAKTAAEDAEEAREESDRIANEKSGDIEKIKADMKKLHDREIKKLNDTIEANKTAMKANEDRLSTLLIDNTINEAIAKNGVLPHFTPAVTAMLKLGAKMENGEAMVDGTPLADKLTSFFTSEDARHYVAAPANSGGGAQGSTTTAAPHTFTKENFESRKAEWLILANKEPQTAKAIAEEVGQVTLASTL